jgi:hypothetical protein
VSPHGDRPRCRRGPGDGAERETERVAGVQSRKDRASVASLEFDTLGVHRDVHDAGGRRHHRERDRQSGKSTDERDREQCGREDRESELQSTTAARAGDHRAA